MPSSAAEEHDLETIRKDNEELRERLDVLARERADEKSELAALKARNISLQHSLDDAHHHLRLRPSTLTRVRGKARRLLAVPKRLVRAAISIPRRLLGGAK